MGQTFTSSLNVSFRQDEEDDDDDNSSLLLDDSKEELRGVGSVLPNNEPKFQKFVDVTSDLSQGGYFKGSLVILTFPSIEPRDGSLLLGKVAVLASSLTDA